MFPFQLINDARKKSDATLISADADSTIAARRIRTKKEPSSISGPGSCIAPSEGHADPADLKDEPGDFIETNCHWRECGTEFPTQDDLVKVRITF